ncbi:ATP-dependent DNA helicase DDX11 [Rhodamnia argentea]|uniref:ATP-dependent DNA helicase DDX11 n=1 Tax=Rhodamnia argentea TaxID=178133 RepID=A0A8B8NWK6_9MYRT|nr:ATP-dependent DNA helicase DDX11 [Rhodamnia argentea]
MSSPAAEAEQPVEVEEMRKEGVGGGGGDWKFPAFPYEPYSIQVDFMNALYSSLERGGISMFESPTGTGKTLSIICSALQWLVDRKEQQKIKVTVGSDSNGAQSVSNPGSDDEPDWMRNFVNNKENQGEDKKKEKFGVGFGKNSGRRNRESNRDLLSRDDKRGNGESYGEFISKSAEKERSLTMKKCENMQSKEVAVESDDEEFLLEEYESEEGESVSGGRSKRKVGGVSISSSSDEGEVAKGSDNEEEEGLKIYFCSRTHSQLSQFVKELRKTAFADEISAVCLGSRKNFCINEGVLKLTNSTRINERCLELQQKKKNDVSKIKNLGAGRMRRTKAVSGCPMLRKHKLQREFKEQLSQQGALDIEELVNLGISLGTCPYYGARSMVPAADLVVLPYQSLLSKSSRESLGLTLKNNVVIIDEAHNLADSLISMYDAKMTLSQLEDVHCHLEMYLERFFNLLGPGNRRYIQTLMVITRAFLGALNEMNRDNLHTSENGDNLSAGKITIASSMAINDFLFTLNIDNINFVKLQHYLKESNIIHKVCGYGNKMATPRASSTFDDTESCGEDMSTLSNFRAFADMLLSLTNKNTDGRIIVSKAKTTLSGRQGGYIKYVMLTGEKIFSEIADQAHAVILAGGTLQPIEETRERLFPWLSLEMLNFFCCSHIVPPESILPVAVSQGPSGQVLDFSYRTRSSLAMIEELGLLLCNLVSVVPEGIVVFFSSFEYEEQVYNAWKGSGILDRIRKKKCVFREPRKNADVELVLKKYKESINNIAQCNSIDAASQNGALFLAVVGGKVSEGINFSDGMGRCIVMVGMPYPNPSDVELMERVKHIEGLGDGNSISNLSLSGDELYMGDVQAGFNILRSCGHRGKEYYENLCFKAVNQSIGRAIRHADDYAAILLVDKRYVSDPSKRSKPCPTDKLPKWIEDRLVPRTNNYGEVHRLLHQFFKFNKRRGGHKTK